MEENEPNQKSDNNSKAKVVINIPSFQEVLETTQSKLTPKSLFAPSETFSQAFAHLKSSEFYSPPPPLTEKTISTSSPNKQSQALQNNSLSEISQSNVQSSSASNSSVASPSSASYTQNRNAILVSHRQKGNPLLKHIRNVKWAFAEVLCDYVLGHNSCALYLSLRFHLLHPDYLYYRIRELQKNFKLRIVLCHVDVEDVVNPLLEVTKTALLHDCTLLCGWSLEECGRYLETIKVYENKSADIIQGQMDTDYLSRLNHALTTIRHVNKTDVVTLGTSFGSLSNIMDASMEDLARCPGIGERKVKRLYDTFHEPFKRVLPNCTPDPGTSTQQNVDPDSVEADEVEKDTESGRKRKKKEPEVTVKSALSAAFAKYANAVVNKNTSGGDREGETSSVMDWKAEMDNTSEYK